MNEIKLGSFVMVIVERPDGCTENVKTYGEIGVISKIEKVNDEYDYTVHNHVGDFIYGKDQLKLLTNEQISFALYNYFMEGRAYC